MTKSVLAHLVGNAIASGALRLEDAVTQHVPELAGSGYAGCTVEHVLTMTTGTDWVEDHRDPTGPATRLISCFVGERRQLARRCSPRSRRWTRPAPGGSTAPPTRRCSTGCASARPARTYAEALTELWRVLGCVRDAVVGRRRRGASRWPAAAWPPAPRTGCGSRRSSSPARRTTRACSGPTGCSAPRRPPSPWLAPGRLPSSITTHAGFGYHWWPLDADGVRVTSDGSRGQFGYVDRDLGVAVLKTSLWPYDDFLVDRQQRDLSYLGLPLVAAAARTAPDTTEVNP